MKNRLFSISIKRILIFIVFLVPLGVNAGGTPHEQLKEAISSEDTKLIYLDFWASWCGPCKASFPWMNQIHEDLSERGLKVVSVNLDSKRKKADKFLKRNPVKFQIIYDHKATLPKTYAVKGMPSSYILDREGNILDSHIGFTKTDAVQLRSKIESLLNN